MVKLNLNEITTRPNAVNASVIFFFQAEDGIRDVAVTGVQTCALPISHTVTTRLITISPRENYRSRRRARAGAGAHRSEEVAQLEVQLEGRCRPPEAVGAVEAVRPIDADGAER